VRSEYNIVQLPFGFSGTGKLLEDLNKYHQLKKVLHQRLTWLPFQFSYLVWLIFSA